MKMIWKKGNSLKKRIFYSLLTLILLLNGMWIPGETSLREVEAAGGSVNSSITPVYMNFKYDVYPPRLLDQNKASYNFDSFFRTEKTALQEGETLPDYYNAAEEGYITSVKDQEVTDLCWSFTICAIAEAYLIKHMGVKKEDADLAEWYLPNFTKEKNYSNSEDPTYGDGGMTPDVEASYVFEDFAALTAWIGPVKEEIIPWDAPYVYCLHDNFRYEAELHLQEVRYFPIDDEVGIKKWIQEYGAAYGIIRYSNKSGHVVTIVGWDDVKEEWIYKDSYGDAQGDRGYKRKKYGTFAGVIGLRFEGADNYDNNYQYDSAWYGVSYTGGAANVFTAKSYEEIEAVGTHIFLNESADSTNGYTIKIYKNLPDNSNPIAGEPAETIIGTFPDSGYYTIPLQNKVSIEPGEIFSVVVETECYIGHDNHCYAEGTSYEWKDGAYEDCIVRDYNCTIKAFTNNVEKTPENLYVEYDNLLPTLYWDEVDGTEGYGIFCKVNGTEQKLAETGDASYTFADNTILPEAYTNVYVKAICNGKFGPASKSKIVFKNKLFINGSVLVESEGNAVSLDWYGGDGADYFRIYADGVLVAESREPYATIKNLERDKTYQLQVSAVKNGQESAKSAEASVTTRRDYVPAWLTVTTEWQKCTFEWENVSPNETLYYEIEIYSIDRRETKEYSKRILYGDPTEYVTNLDYGKYKARVSASRTINDIPCEWVEFQVGEGLDANLKVVSDNGQISASWDPLENMDGYRLTLCDRRDYSTVSEVIVEDTQYTFTELENDVLYELLFEPIREEEVMDEAEEWILCCPCDYADEIRQPEAVNNELTYGQRLGEISLINKNGEPEQRWIWENANKVPGVKETTAVILFPINGEEKYKNHPDCSYDGKNLRGNIEIKVNPAIPEIVLENDGVWEYEYGLTWDEMDIPAKAKAIMFKSGYQYLDVEGVFRWANTDELPEIPSQSGIYKIIFEPKDQVNYEKVEAEVNVVLKAGKRPDNVPVTDMKIPYVYRTLQDVILPKNWEWKEGTDVQEELPLDVPVTASAVYHGEDESYFNTTEVDIQVTRESCTHTYQELKNRRAASCTEEGYTGDTSCCYCGLTTYGSVLQAGHSWAVKYEKGEDGHWLRCIECQVTTQVEAHVFNGEEDGDCELCGFEREVSTPSPTPTVAPTEEPSPTPTVAPTEEPSATPTVAPTEEPSATPTVAPTEEPSATPTVVPTEEPSPTPTVVPTEEPSPTPTVVPTEEPSPTPTVAPTEEPSPTPTVAPTEEPSPTPTVVPTEEPSPTPTVAPTEEPSPTPTVAPTEEPSPTPTVVPTETPSPTPTVAPTEEPSPTPTVAPTEEPSPTPTVVPTDSPKLTTAPRSTELPEEEDVMNRGDLGENSEEQKNHSFWLVWILLPIMLLIVGSVCWKEYQKRRRK